MMILSPVAPAHVALCVALAPPKGVFGPEPLRWGEPVSDFTACLRQHRNDRKLSRASLYYWVCAYANNQWNVYSEIGAWAEKLTLEKWS